MNSKSNPFTSDELAFIAEMLATARNALLDCAAKHARINPRAQCLEQLRIEAEHCDDVRATIEALD